MFRRAISVLLLLACLSIFGASIAAEDQTSSPATLNLGRSGGVTTEWYPSEDGKLACQVSLDKREYVEGEPVVVTFTVVNTGSEVLNFAAPRLPNSPTGFLWARMETEYGGISFCTEEKGGSIIELSPKAMHQIHFVLGKHPDLPHFSEIDYAHSVHFPESSSAVKPLRRGTYQLSVRYSGRRDQSEGNAERINRALLERNVWPGNLAPPSLTVLVKSNGKPEPTNEVDSLTCEIKTDRTRLAPGESVVVTRTLHNTAEEPRQYYGFDFGNDYLFLHWVNRATGKREIQPVNLCRFASPRTIKGGAAVVEEMTYKAPGMGVYDFYISCEVPGRKERLVSNTIMVRVAFDLGDPAESKPK